VARGWRNLHHPSPCSWGRFIVEGEGGPCVVSGDGRTTRSSSRGNRGPARRRAPTDLASLGWSAALRTHRPFLSYNELGSLLDEGPSKLYDALSSILGLEDVVQALAALQEARRSREKALKETTEARGHLLERCAASTTPEPPRGLRPGRKEWTLVRSTRCSPDHGAGTGEAQVDVLRGIASLEPPDPAQVAAAVAEMREARRRCATRPVRPPAATGTPRPSWTSRCNTTGDTATATAPSAAAAARWTGSGAPASEKRWRASATPAREADAAHERAEAARRRWEQLVTLPPDAFKRATEAGLELGELVGALGKWVQAASIADLTVLADHVESASGPLGRRSSAPDSARAELGRREDAWRPAAVRSPRAGAAGDAVHGAEG